MYEDDSDGVRRTGRTSTRAKRSQNPNASGFDTHDLNTSNIMGYQSNRSENVGPSLGAIACQLDASPDLKVVSTPRIHPLFSNPSCYAYDQRGGQNAVIYVIEEGIENDPSARTEVSASVPLLDIPRH